MHVLLYLADSDSDAELGPQDKEGAGHDGRRELAPSEHTLNEGACGWVDRARQVWAQTGGGSNRGNIKRTVGIGASDTTQRHVPLYKPITPMP